MSPDISKIVDALVLIVPSAAVGTYIGNRLRMYLNRAKPDISIAAIRGATKSDFVGLKVSIPPDVSNQFRHDPWAPFIFESVDADKICDYIEAIELRLTQAKDTLEFLEHRIGELPVVGTGTDKEKLAFLDYLANPEHKMIDEVVTASLVRKDLVLPLPSDDELEQLPLVAEYRERGKGGGYDINLGNAWYTLTYGAERDNQYLLPAAKAFAYFHEPSLRELLLHTKGSISNLAATGQRSVDGLSKLLEDVRHLIIEVRITNRGMSPVTFTQWALLKIAIPSRKSDAGRVQLVRRPQTTRTADADRQFAGSEADVSSADSTEEREGYFVVPPNYSIKIVYKSLQTLKSIAGGQLDIESILNLDLFYCTSYLRRGDIEKPKSAWVHSAATRFGLLSERFPSHEITDVVGS
ncbi:MAG: hypothetical protein GY832_14470 [Chloroflexi bacterium]|nr:hypothetical protein [Chloroflexota bacterium]